MGVVNFERQKQDSNGTFLEEAVARLTSGRDDIWSNAVVCDLLIPGFEFIMKSKGYTVFVIPDATEIKL